MQPTDTQNTKTVKKRSLLVKILRILGFFLLSLVLLVIILLLALQTAPVQNFARKKIVVFLQNKLHTKVEIGKLDVDFPKKLVLENVYFQDQQKDTLLYGGQLKVDLDMWKLLHSDIQINEINLNRITAKVKRQLPDTTFNFQFILDAFAPANAPDTSKKDTAAIKLNIEKLVVDKTRFIYDDIVTGNDVDIYLNHFDTRITTFDLNNLKFEIPTITLNGIRGNIKQTKPLLIQAVSTTPTPENNTTQPKFLQLINKKLLLSDVAINYDNQISGLTTQLSFGALNVYPQKLDLKNTTVVIDKIELQRLDGFLRMGKASSDVVKLTNENKQEVMKGDLPWRVNVNAIELDDNNFKFDDESKRRIVRGMDYAHMDIKDLTLHANNFAFNKDSIAGEITEGQMSEKSGFVLNTLEAKFVYTDKGASIQGLLIKTPGTTLQRSAVVSYPSLEALQKNIGLLELNVDIADSKVRVKDILIFAPALAAQPAFRNPNTTLFLDARIRGSVSRLRIDKFQAHGLGNTRVDVSGAINGLPDAKNLSADLSIRNLSTTRIDIYSFVPAGTIPSNITLPQSISASGTVKGNMSGMIADLGVNTSLGSAKIRGQIANATDKLRATYNAAISASRLDLGTILQNPKQMGKLSANFTVKGKGFDPKSTNASIKGKIISAEFNKYVYKNLSLDASLVRQRFNATAAMRDPNLDFSLSAAGDISGKYPSLSLEANIDSIKTKPLNLTPNAIIYRGKINADFPQLNPDALTGNLLVTQSLLVMDGQRIPMDTLSVVANYTEGQQYLAVKSDFINAKLEGQYKLTQLGSIIQQSIQPYFAIAPVTAAPAKVDPYNFNIDVTISNHPTLKGFVPLLDLSQPITLTGNFSNTGGWKALVNVPQVVYGTNNISGLVLNAATEDNALKITTNLNRFTSGKTITVYATTLNATLANNQILFDLLIKDAAAKDKYRLGGQLAQTNGDTYTFSLAPDNLLLNYNAWSVTPGNLIRISPKDIFSSNFTLSQSNQQLGINSTGAASNSPLQVSFANFKISTITGFVQSDSLMVDGTINGNVLLKNVLTQPSFTTDLNINDLAFKKDTIGNVNVKVNNNTQNVFATNVTITGKGNDVNLTGNYYLKPDNKSNFDFVLDIRSLPFKTIETVSMGAINQSTGNLTGKVSINGTVQSPNIDGGISFNKTGFNVVMLGSYFQIDNETIKVNNQGIKFDTFTIRDSASNSLVIDGMAYTSNFTNYRFDMTVRARNFRALNSTKRQNALYYGQLYFNSNLNIKGTETAPVVDGNLRINDKTALTIVLPQSEPGIVDRKGVIEFIDMDAPMNDSLFKATMALYDSSFNKSAVTGFDVSVNIEVVKEAEFNLIIDEGNGDFLKVKGEALLNGGIDPSGKITLTGSYEIDQGGYELSFNFLHRRFDIQKGSKITWTGEPTTANVDVTAVYVANTSALDLVKDQVTGNTNVYLQKLPFQVRLIIKGELMRPILTFDIALPTENNARTSNEVLTTVNTRLDQLKQEPSELNKQVFALLLLNRFVSENPFESSGGGGGFNAGAFARQSVSKILTEQLNKLASDLIAGVEINFDVNSSEDYTTGQLRNRTDFNVALSKRLLNDRLKVTVGSNYELEGPQQSKQNASNVIGNVTVDYALSRDGRYLLRGYRKNEYEAIVEGYVVETGLRFIISVDYNQFKEIFQRSRRKRNRKEENKPTQSTTANMPAGDERSIIQLDKVSADDRRTVPATAKVSTDEK